MHSFVPRSRNTHSPISCAPASRPRPRAGPVRRRTDRDGARRPTAAGDRPRRRPSATGKPGAPRARPSRRNNMRRSADTGNRRGSRARRHRPNSLNPLVVGVAYRTITVARPPDCYGLATLLSDNPLGGYLRQWRPRCFCTAANIKRGLNWITAIAMTGFHLGAVAALFYIDCGAMLAAFILYYAAGCSASAWAITACSRIAATRRRSGSSTS